MMAQKKYPMPDNFSGRKFAARYGLDTMGNDFWSDGVFLYVPDNLPDDPPIFEHPDPLPPQRRILIGPAIGSEGDVPDLYGRFDAALVAAINQPGTPTPAQLKEIFSALRVLIRV